MAISKTELASEASELLRSPAFREAVTRLKERYKDQWVIEEDAAQRESLHRKTRLIDDVVSELQTCITDTRY